jgi:hypothetical protein
MFTDEQKNSIKEEENIRQEARREAEKKEKQQSSLKETSWWAFLNSPFTVLLFSTAIVGVFGWAFSTCQTLNKEQSDKIELQNKLKIEAGSRVEETLVTLDILRSNVQKNFDKPGGCYSPIVINQTAVELLNRNITSIPAAVPSGAYSEFEKTGMQGLISEWERIVDEKDRTDFEQALTEFQELRQHASDLEDYDCDTIEKLTEKKKKLLSKEIEGKRNASIAEIDFAKKRVNDMKQHFVSKSISWFIYL